MNEETRTIWLMSAEDMANRIEKLERQVKELLFEISELKPRPIIDGGLSPAAAQDRLRRRKEAGLDW